MSSSSSVSCLLVCLLLPTVLSTQHSSIKQLPGFSGDLPFKLQTGYIGVGELEEVQLFYYFTESERSPENDPLVLWLSGGPGCSAFSGLVYEIGAFSFDYENSRSGNLPKLKLNPYSWTKVANIIFLDQPVGTGFSYATTWQAYNTNDTVSAQQIYEFLQKWFVANPRFMSNSFYVFGDSYGGKIVPIVVQIISNGIDKEQKPRMNLKGYGAGNPVTFKDVDRNSRIEFAYMKSLIPYDLYQETKRHCNGEYFHANPKNYLCQAHLDTITKVVEKINGENILEPSCFNFRIIEEYQQPNIFLVLPTDDDHSSPLCRYDVNYNYSETWANDNTVQKALGIREGTIKQWVRCNCSSKSTYTQDIKNAVVYHQNLTKKDYRVLIYSGDQDLTIPHLGTEEWINSLKLRVKESWQPWFVDDQIAGYSVVYKVKNNHFTFATVKGAGHTAPEYKPKECFAMISRWFAEYPL